MDDDERIRRLLAETRDDAPARARLDQLRATRDFSAADRHLVPRLKELLATGGSFWQMHCVALALARIGGAQALDAMIELAESDDSTVRSRGLACLGKFVPENERQAEAVVWPADRCLDSAGGGQMVLAIRIAKPFRRHVSPALRGATSSPDLRVRIAASVEVLRLTGDAAPLVPAIEAALAEYIGGMHSQEARSMCDYALAHVQNCGPAAVAAVPILVACWAPSTPSRRVEILKALGSIGRGSPQARAAIAAAIGETSFPVRMAAIEAARKLGPSVAAETVPALTRATSAKNLHVRRAAEQALAAIRPGGA